MTNDPPEQARLFLATLFGEAPDAGRISIFTLPDRAAARFTNCDQAAAYAMEQAATQNVYVGCGLVRPDLAGTGRGKVEDITAISALWSDVDCEMPYRRTGKKLFPSTDKALEMAHSLPLPPSIIVHSGGGLYLWWLFREPWELETPAERSQAATLSRNWTATIGAHAERLGYGDSVDATHSLEHVLRLPGALNHKPEATGGDPLTVAILELNDRRYNPSDFDEYLIAPTTERKPQRSSSARAPVSAKDIEQAKAALARLSKNRVDDYHQWLEVGMALSELGDPGFGLWEEWSANSSKYQEGECAAKWETFTAGDGITLASLFHWASEDDPKPRSHAPLEEPPWLKDAPPPEGTTESPPGGAQQKPQGGAPRQLPAIYTSGASLRDLTAQSLQALEQANRPARIFVRSGALTRIGRDEHGLPVIQPLSEAALRGHMARAADYIRIGPKDQEIPVPPPRDVVWDLAALGSWPFPPLGGIIEAPAIREDGTLLTEPGYDPATRLYYVPSDSLHMCDVPTDPTSQEIGTAIELLKEIVCNFPFDSMASAVNALAATLTPVLRPLIPGPVPMVLIDKPQAGTGASLLAEVIALIATGRSSAMMTAPKDDESWRKNITSMLMAGRTVVTVDNLEWKLFAPSLAALLTATTWQDRILGRNELVTLPHRATWLGTGNNIRLGGDLPRRCFWIRMDAQQARPWQRSGFKHPDLMAWIAQERGRIIVAILTLARAWAVAGRPEPATLPTIGGFSSWVGTIGGILDYAGVKGFLSNLDAMYDQADEDLLQWEAFLAAWGNVWEKKPVTVAMVAQELATNVDLEAALPDDLADGIITDQKGERKPSKGFTRKLGKALAARADVHFPGGAVVRKKGEAQRAITWVVETGELREFSEFGSHPATLRNKDISIWEQLETNSPNTPNSPSGVSSTRIRIEQTYLGPALWHTKDHDMPVVVTGYLGELAGVHYVSVEGSDTGLRLDHLTRERSNGKALGDLTETEQSYVTEADNLPF